MPGRRPIPAVGHNLWVTAPAWATPQPVADWSSDECVSRARVRWTSRPAAVDAGSCVQEPVQGQDCSRHRFTPPTASTTRAGTKNSPMCKIPPAMPAARTSTPAMAASLFSGAGVNAAAAVSGAGAMASSSDHHVTASGSALVSAEMVISCAAPARISAPRRHAQLGGAGTAEGFTWVLAAGALSVGACGVVVIAGSWWTISAVTDIAPTRLPGSPG